MAGRADLLEAGCAPGFWLCFDWIKASGYLGLFDKRRPTILPGLTYKSIQHWGAKTSPYSEWSTGKIPTCRKQGIELK
jgi:hypothetical protein